MPPKPAAKANPAEDALAEKQKQLAQIKRQCEAYERMVQIGSEQLQRSQLEKLNLKKKVVELNERFKIEESLTSSMTHEMFKTYTTTQRDLMSRIEAHQDTIKGLNKELRDLKSSLELTKQQRDLICAEKTRKINEQKQKMEEMAIAFGVKLKETLEQMSRHIQGDKHQGHA